MQQQGSTEQLEHSLRYLSFCCEPSASDGEKRLAIIEGLCALLRETFKPPSALVARPYGSFISGFYTPSSDLDIALYGDVELNLLPEPVRIEIAKLVPAGKATAPMALLDHDARAAVLAKFANALCLSGMCRANYVERVLAARIPILKMTEVTSNVQVDVCCGLVGSAFKHDIIGRMSYAEPRIKQLFRLVKLWAKSHGLNDGMNGTFNSWSLTLMVLFALQSSNPAVLPPMWHCFAKEESSPPPVEDKPNPPITTSDTEEGPQTPPLEPDPSGRVPPFASPFLDPAIQSLSGSRTAEPSIDGGASDADGVGSVSASGASSKRVSGNANTPPGSKDNTQVPAFLASKVAKPGAQYSASSIVGLERLLGGMPSVSGAQGREKILGVLGGGHGAQAVERLSGNISGAGAYERERLLGSVGLRQRSSVDGNAQKEREQQAAPEAGGTTPDPLGIRLLMHWRLSLDSSDDDNASAEDLHRALDQCSKWAEQAHARVNAEGGARPAQDWGLLECLHWFLTLWSCIVDEWEAGRCRGHRVSVWMGQFLDHAFKVPYLCLVEDPFDYLDNTARTVGCMTTHHNTLPYIAHVLRLSVKIVQEARGGRTRDMQKAIVWLFGPEGAKQLFKLGGGQGDLAGMVKALSATGSLATMPSTNSATTNAAPGSEAATAEGDTAEEEERRLAGAVKDMQLGSRDSAISSRRSSKGVDGENGGEGKGESADVKEGDMVAVRQQMLMLPPEWWEGAQRVAQQGRNSVEVHRHMLFLCGLPPEPLTAGLWMKQRREARMRQQEQQNRMQAQQQRINARQQQQAHQAQQHQQQLRQQAANLAGGIGGIGGPTVGPTLASVAGSLAAPAGLTTQFNAPATTLLPDGMRAFVGGNTQDASGLINSASVSLAPQTAQLGGAAQSLANKAMQELLMMEEQERQWQQAQHQTQQTQLLQRMQEQQQRHQTEAQQLLQKVEEVRGQATSVQQQQEMQDLAIAAASQLDASHAQERQPLEQMVGQIQLQHAQAEQALQQRFQDQLRLLQEQQLRQALLQGNAQPQLQLQQPQQLIQQQPTTAQQLLQNSTAPQLQLQQPQQMLQQPQLQLQQPQQQLIQQQPQTDLASFLASVSSGMPAGSQPQFVQQPLQLMGQQTMMGGGGLATQALQPQQQQLQPTQQLQLLQQPQQLQPQLQPQPFQQQLVQPQQMQTQQLMQPQQQQLLSTSMAPQLSLPNLQMTAQPQQPQAFLPQQPLTQQVAQQTFLPQQQLTQQQPLSQAPMQPQFQLAQPQGQGQQEQLKQLLMQMQRGELPQQMPQATMVSQAPLQQPLQQFQQQPLSQAPMQPQFQLAQPQQQLQPQQGQGQQEQLKQLLMQMQTGQMPMTSQPSSSPKPSFAPLQPPPFSNSPTNAQSHAPKSAPKVWPKVHHRQIVGNEPPNSAPLYVNNQAPQLATQLLSQQSGPGLEQRTSGSGLPVAPKLLMRNDGGYPSHRSSRDNLDRI